MTHLFHNSRETVSVMDCEGRTYRIPPHKAWPVPALQGTDCNGTQAYAPFTIPADQMAAFFMKEGRHHGLVAVPEVTTDAGIVFDLQAAAAKSTHARVTAEDSVLEGYIKGAKEDELAQLPVKPPSPAIQRILDSRNLDLKRDFGLTPVGYKVSEGAAARDAEMDTLRKENAEARKENAEIKDMLKELLSKKKPVA